MNNEQIKELINRRRRQLTVHSFLYYQLNTNIISDITFDTWAKELADLQEAYPKLSKEVPFAKEFEGFDGSSGFDLPYTNPYFQDIGFRLLKTHKEKTSG